MRIRFSHGVEIDTSGPLRTLHLHDGWYVVGEGLLIPCTDKQDAEDTLRRLREGST